jgi:FkbM family methyltransferase
MNNLDIIENTIFKNLSKIESNSQLLQDCLVVMLTNFKQSGYFVEFGACDGKYLSNTLLLEKKYNWTGILAEPSRHFHNLLIKNRNCLIDFRAVYHTSKLNVDFRDITDHIDLSGIVNSFNQDKHRKKRNIGNTYTVETVSLTDLLNFYNAPSVIDYISIDTEGSEYEILKNFDFNRYSITIFTIEHNYIESQRNQIKELMEKNNYRRIFVDYSKWDDWYILNS